MKKITIANNKACKRHLKHVYLYILTYQIKEKSWSQKKAFWLIIVRFETDTGKKFWVGTSHNSKNQNEK